MFSTVRPSTFHTACALAVACAACGPPADRGADAAPSAGVLTELAVQDATGPVAGTSFADVRDAGRGRVHFMFVPSSGFAYRDDSGGLTGVTVELLRDFARHVAATHGIALEIEWLEEPLWADFYGYVRDSAGGVLGVGNVTITEPRRDELDFSPPYLDNIAVLVTHERVPELASLEDIPATFAGLTALPYPGTLHEARLDTLRARWAPALPARPVASNDELVTLLGSDGEYVAYIDVYNYWRARQAGAPLRRHPVGDDGSETFGVVLPRGSDWTPELDAFFRAHGGYARSDRFRTLLREHLGDELAALLTGNARDDG
jgi:ABC-type amino acid transport substrate-binding protein